MYLREKETHPHRDLYMNIQRQIQDLTKVKLKSTKPDVLKHCSSKLECTVELWCSTCMVQDTHGVRTGNLKKKNGEEKQ